MASTAMLMRIVSAAARGESDQPRAARSPDEVHAGGDGSWPRAVRTSTMRSRHGSGLLVCLGLDDLLAAVVTARADVMAKMDLAADRFHRKRRLGKKRVGAMHAALRRRFFILLDSHVQCSSIVRSGTLARAPGFIASCSFLIHDSLTSRLSAGRLLQFPELTERGRFSLAAFLAGRRRHRRVAVPVRMTRRKWQRQQKLVL